MYESIVCSSFHTYWFHASKNCVGVVLNKVKRCLDSKKKKKRSGIKSNEIEQNNTKKGGNHKLAYKQKNEEINK